MKKKLISFLIALVALMPVASIASPQKLATMINDQGTKKITVVGSSDAQWYFTLGYHLMTNVLGGTGTIYQTPSLFETSLASAITSSATSATLVSGKTRDGFSLSGNYCFTIDSGLNTAEYVCGVASGTALTALQRGIGADGVSTISSLQFAHRYGADVKVTDFPVLQQFGRILNGQDSTPGGITFGTNAITGLTTPSSSATSSAANVGYVNGVAVAGAPNGSNTVKGIWQGATPAQQASASSTGSTGAGLALQSQYASSTTLGSSTANYAVITDSNGRLDPSFLAGTSTNYTFNGTATFNGTTTINNGFVPTTTPTLPGQIVGLNASSSLPAVDGSKLTNLSIVTKSGVFSKDTSESSGTTATITHGLGKVPSFFRLVCYTGSGTSFVGVSTGSYNGSSYNTIYAFYSVQGNSTSVIAYLGNGSNNNTWMTGAITTFNSTQVVITWTKNGSMSGMANCYWEAQ